MTLEKITILQEEYNLLKVYEKDINALLKFLAIEHHDIYISFIEFRLKRIEEKMVELGK